MKITASACNINTDILDQYTKHFLVTYRKKATELIEKNELDSLNLKSFLKEYYGTVQKLAEGQSVAEKNEKALIATLVGSSALISRANNPADAKYFTDSIIAQLNQLTWKYPIDDSKKEVIKYLDLEIKAKPAATFEPVFIDNELDTEKGLYEINTMDVSLLFQPTDSDFYDSNSVSSNVKQNEGLKSFRKFIDKYLNNRSQAQGITDPAYSDLYIRLYNKSDLDRSKLYGDSKGSKYVYVVTDATGKPIQINTDGAIEDSALYYVAFYSRIPDTIIDNILDYTETLQDNNNILKELVDRGLVLDPNKYKIITYTDAEKKLNEVTDPKYRKILEDRLQAIRQEREEYKTSLIDNTKRIALFLKQQILSNPETNLIRIGQNVRYGYLRYISKTSPAVEKGSNFITSAEGSKLGAIKEVSYNPIKVEQIKKSGAVPPFILINGKYKVFIYQGDNKVRYQSKNINERLLPIVNALVDMMSDDTITFKGDPISTELKQVIFQQFFFLENKKKHEAIIYNFSGQDEVTFEVSTRGQSANESIIFKKQDNPDAFKENLRASLMQTPFNYISKSTVLIPEIIQDGDTKTFNLREVKDVDFVSQYFKFPITLKENEVELPILNPVLGINTNAPFNAGDTILQEETETVKKYDAEEWKSKKTPNLSTDKLNKKALEWFKNSPFTKNVPLQVLFDIVNSNALATWSRAGITLYSGSNYTDLYHEAWHEFTELYLTSDQRQTLFDEVKKIKGKVTYYYRNETITKPASQIETYAEAMEFLAEEYRSYAINESASVVSKVIKAIFKKIKEVLNTIFGRTTALDTNINVLDNPIIREMFENLYVGNMADYKYYIQPGSNNILEKTIVGTSNDKNTRDSFSKDESVLLQETIDSLLFNSLKQVKDISPDNDQFLFTKDLKTIFQSSNVDKLHRFLTNELQKRLNLYETLAQDAVDVDLKTEYQNNVSLLSKALRNIGNVDKLKNQTENRGLIKFYIEQNKFINQVYKDEEELEFNNKDEGQFNDKGNNHTSIASDMSAFLTYMFQAMPKQKLLRENTLYINYSDQNEKDSLRIAIKKVGNKYFTVNMLTGDTTEIAKETFFDYFSKDSFIERNKLGLPISQKSSAEIVNKLATTEEITGSTKPISIYEKLKQLSRKGDKSNLEVITNSYFYSNVYTVIGGDNIHNFMNNKTGVEKIKNSPNAQVYFSTLKSNYFIFTSLIQSLSRHHVPLLIVNVDVNDETKAISIDPLISNTQHISMWYKREEDYNSLLNSDLGIKDLDRYGIISRDGKYRFNPAKFYDTHTIFKPNSKGIAFDAATKKPDELAQKIILYLKLLGILDMTLEYPTSIFVDTMIKDGGDLTAGLNALNNALYKLSTLPYDRFTRADIETIKNPVTLFKKGLPINSDLKQYTLIEKIFKIVNKIEAVSNDFMIKNAKGDSENEFSLVSSLSRSMQLYNEKSPLTAQDSNSNPFYEKSELRKLIVEKGYNLRLLKAGGSKFGEEGVSEGDNDTYTAIVEAIINLRLQKAHRLPQHAGASTQHYVTINNQEFITYNDADPIQKLSEKLYNYLIAEVIRIKQTENGYHEGEEVFSDQGKKYLYFDYLNKKENANTKESLITKENLSKLEKLVEDNLEKSTKEIYDIVLANKEIKKSLVESIATYQTKRINNRFAAINNTFPDYLTEIDKTLNEKLGLTGDQGDGKKLYTYFDVNKYIFSIEADIFFYGDKANYRIDKEEFPKRNKLFGSGGNVIYSDPTFVSFTKDLFSFEGINQELINLEKLPVVVLADVVAKSSEYEALKKAIAEIVGEEKAEDRASGYKKMKEADAQGLIALPVYRLVSLVSNNWSPIKEDYYNRIMNGQELPDNVQEFFPSLKYQFIGPASYEKGDKTKKIQTFSLKFNLVPLIPSVLKVKIGDVEKERYLNRIYEKMLNENIAILTFVSGSKNTFYFNKESNVFYNNEGDVSNLNFAKNFINTIFFKDQLYIAPVFKGKAPISSQKRTKILDLMFKNGKIAPAFEKHTSKINNYKDSVKNASRVFKEMLLDKLKIDPNNIDNKGFVKFAEYIKETLKSKGFLTEDEIDLIQTVDGKFAFDYTSSGYGSIIDNVIANIIEKNVLQQKFPGEALVQVASTGWEFVENKRTFDKSNITTSNDLKSYRLSEDGTTILPAQTRISMQGSFYNLLNLTHTDGNPIGTIPRLNEMMAKPEWKKLHMDKFIITGDRIPVHAHPSMEFLEIVEFLNPAAGNIIVLPTEAVGKSGGDYDVDKLTLLFPTIDTQGNLLEYSLTYKEAKQRVIDGKEKLNVQKNKSAAYYKLLRKILDAVKRDIKYSKSENIGEVVSKNKLKRYTKVATENKEGLAEYEDFYIDADETIESLETKIEEMSESIDLIYNDVAALSEKEQGSLTKEEEILIKETEEYLANVYYLKNIIGAIGNNVNKSIASLLSIKELFPYLILPTSDEDIKSIADREQNKALDEFYLPDSTKNPSILIDPLYDASRLDFNAAGKDSLSIVAVMSSILNEFIQAGLKIAPGTITTTKNGNTFYDEYAIPFDYNSSLENVELIRKREGKLRTVNIKVKALDYSKLLNKNGQLIFDITGQKIQGSVDVEKNPYIIRTGIRKETVSLQLALATAGVSEESLSMFLLNPAITKYIRYQKMGKHPLRNVSGTYGSLSYSNNQILERLYSTETFNKLIKEYKFDENGEKDDSIKQELQNILLQKNEEGYNGWNSYKIRMVSNALAEYSKEEYADPNINQNYYTSDLNKAKGLVHYIALNSFVDATIGKFSFALRPDRQRYSSALDILAFNNKRADLLDNLADFSKKAVARIENESVRSSYYINYESLVTPILTAIAPTLDRMIRDIYRLHYKGVTDNKVIFKDGKSAVNFYSTIYRSYILQTLLEQRYTGEFYKGFNLLTSTDFTESRQTEIALNNNDFNILLRSAVKIVENADGQKTLYINKLNINLFSKLVDANDITDSDFYIQYGIAKPDKNILSNSKLLEKYLIELAVVSSKYKIEDFTDSIYYKNKYETRTGDYSNITEKTLEKQEKEITKANKEQAAKEYAYSLFIKDMATIGSLPVDVLKNGSYKNSNIAYYIYNLKRIYNNSLIRSYPILNEILTRGNSKNTNLEIEVAGIKNNLEYYRLQMQNLINPTIPKVESMFDNMVISDILTGIGLFSIIQNNSRSSASRVQQLFVTKSLMKNLLTVPMSPDNLRELLKDIYLKTKKSHIHKVPGYIYTPTTETVETENVLTLVPFRESAQTNSTLLIVKQPPAAINESESATGTSITVPKILKNEDGLIIAENVIPKEDTIKIVEQAKDLIEETSFKQTAGAVSWGYGKQWMRINAMTPAQREGLVIGKQLNGYEITQDMKDNFIKTGNSKGFPLYGYTTIDKNGNKLPPIPKDIVNYLSSIGIDISQYDASYNSVYDKEDAGSLIIHQDNTETNKSPIITISLGRPMKFITYELTNPDDFNVADSNNTAFRIAVNAVSAEALKLNLIPQSAKDKSGKIKYGHLTPDTLLKYAEQIDKKQGTNLKQFVIEKLKEQFKNAEKTEYSLKNGAVLVFSGKNRNVLHEIVFDSETNEELMESGFPTLKVNKAFKGLNQADRIVDTNDYRVVLTLRKVEGPTLTNVVNESTLINSLSSTDITQAPISGANNPAEYTNHSGGAKGYDAEWDLIGAEFGMVNNKHYLLPSDGAVSDSRLLAKGVKPVDATNDVGPVALQGPATGEAQIAVTNAERAMGRIEPNHTTRNTKKIRNYAQVKNADGIFAIGSLIPKGADITVARGQTTKKALVPQVNGGTSVAVQLGITMGKPTYVFNQVANSTYSQGWYKWDNAKQDFVSVNTPVLTKNFAGIGTSSNTTEAGKQAIRDVYANTFKASTQAQSSIPIKGEYTMYNGFTEDWEIIQVDIISHEVKKEVIQGNKSYANVDVYTVKFPDGIEKKMYMFGDKWLNSERKNTFKIIQPAVTLTQPSTSVKPDVKDLSRWSDLSKATDPYTDDGIVVTRISNTEEHFGNPFIGSQRRDKNGNLVKSKVDNITVFNTIDEADQAYRDWLMGVKHQNIKPLRREWILKQINEGKLDGKTLLYYKPMEVYNNDGTIIKGGYHSHADTLAEIVEELRTKPTTPTVSEGIEINSKQTGLGNDLTNVHYATNGKSKFDIKPSDTSLTLTTDAKNIWGESVEAWYKSNNAMSKGIPEGTEGDAYDMKLMIGLITDKLKQYPNLVTQITERGGLAFLDKSTHTMGTDRWSSKNPKNMFMNALKQAYQNVSATPTVTAKPTSEKQQTRSTTPLKVYLPDYKLAKSAYIKIQKKISEGLEPSQARQEVYTQFYKVAKENFDAIPKDINFKIVYRSGKEEFSETTEQPNLNAMVYGTETERDKDINQIMVDLLYINSYIIAQNFGKIETSFVPRKTQLKLMVKQTIENANISEEELNNILKLIDNC